MQMTFVVVVFLRRTLRLQPDDLFVGPCFPRRRVLSCRALNFRHPLRPPTRAVGPRVPRSLFELLAGSSMLSMEKNAEERSTSVARTLSRSTSDLDAPIAE